MDKKEIILISCLLLAFLAAVIFGWNTFSTQAHGAVKSTSISPSITSKKITPTPIAASVQSTMHTPTPTLTPTPTPKKDSGTTSGSSPSSQNQTSGSNSPTPATQNTEELVTPTPTSTPTPEPTTSTPTPTVTITNQVVPGNTGGNTTIFTGDTTPVGAFSENSATVTPQ